MATSSRMIVLAVDESEPSLLAVTWSLKHLIRKHDHVVFINVVPPSAFDFPSSDLASEYILLGVPSGISGASEKEVAEQSTLLVNAYMSKCQKAGVSCEGEVVKGEPGSWIVDKANQAGADLVIVGSHDYGVIKSILFLRTLAGSISDYVLHNSSCPVAIIRNFKELVESEATELSRKIVIAVDESDEAVFAFKWALQNVCTESDKVVIYHVHQHVADPITAAGTGAFDMDEVYVPPETSDKAEVQALYESEKLVERFMAFVSQETKVSCEGMVVTGQTEAKVCEGLNSLKADAVVVGTHNRGVIARTFLGSVSNYLAHHSPCPLIVVKSTKHASTSFDGKSHNHLP